eukprot:m51a1_g11272 hypothetical protein (289) ;mRNA; r:3064-26138
MSATPSPLTSPTAATLWPKRPPRLPSISAVPGPRSSCSPPTEGCAPLPRGAVNTTYTLPVAGPACDRVDPTTTSSAPSPLRSATATAGPNTAAAAGPSIRNPPSKKQDKFYNGKYKGHVVKIQVVVNNQGIPMDVQGLVEHYLGFMSRFNIVGKKFKGKKVMSNDLLSPLLQQYRQATMPAARQDYEDAVVQASIVAISTLTRNRVTPTMDEAVQARTDCLEDQIIKGLETARAKLKEKIAMYKKEQVRVTNELHEQHVLIATLKSQNEGLKEQLELLKSDIYYMLAA